MGGYHINDQPKKYNFRSSKSVYNRCCNPMKKAKHIRTNGLRKVTEKIKAIYPHLESNDRICDGCCKTIDKMPLTTSQPKTPSQVESTSEVPSSIASSPVISSTVPSDYCQENLQTMLEVAEEETVPLSVPANLVKDSVDFFNNLKKVYSTKCTRSQQIQILTLLPTTWTATTIMRHFDCNWRMIQTAKQNQNSEVLGPLDPKKGKSLSPEIIELVQNYYIRDDVSSVMPGIKDTISVRQSNGIKENVQKRLLLLNLKELYQGFKEEYSEIKVGFSKFCTLRPKNCILVGSSGTHSICVCAHHQNVKLLLLGSSIPTLTKNSSFEISTYRDCFDILLCGTPSDDCYFGRCDQCPKKNILEEILCDLFDENNVSIVTYKQWISNPRATLETLVKSSEEFVPYFSQKVCELLPHAFIAMNQSSFSREVKENLSTGEYQVIVDFAENYAFTVQDAIPGFHWNNNQATVYNIVIYYKEETDVKHCSLVIISDCLSHDTVSVYTFHKILIQFLKSKFAVVTKILYFSDGAPQQYKNYKNVLNLSYHKTDFGVDAEWHYYATAHGKGPCDGLGAVVKRAAVRASLQSVNNTEILTSKDLFNWLSTTPRLTNIVFRYSPEQDYKANKKHLNKRFQSSARVNHLQEQHCLIPMENNIIRAKPYSSSSNYVDHQIKY